MSRLGGKSGAGGAGGAAGEPDALACADPAKRNWRRTGAESATGAQDSTSIDDVRKQRALRREARNAVPLERSRWWATRMRANPRYSTR